MELESTTLKSKKYRYDWVVKRHTVRSCML